MKHTTENPGKGPGQGTVIQPTRDTPGWMQGKESSDGMGGTLFFVLAMVFLGVAFFYLRRKGFWKVPGSVRKDGKGIEVMATRPLGNRQYLVQVRCQDRNLLLGVSPGEIRCLQDLGNVSFDPLLEEKEK